jgi:serine/threonine protein phosphatase PrpC
MPVLFAAVTAISHDGLIRDHNEDSVVVGPWTLCASTTLTPQTLYFPMRDDPLVVAVADGLGGHPAGDLASSLVASRLARVGATLTDADAVRDAIVACDAELYEQAALDRARTGMGTTIAGVVLKESRVDVFNVGDSRVYEFDGNELVQLSADDNQPAAPGRRRSVVVTQCLGGGLESEVLQPHISSRPLAGPARYLLCTDGLSDTVDDPAIATILREHDGGRAAFELWKASIQAGAPDNVTLVLVEIAD